MLSYLAAEWFFRLAILPRPRAYFETSYFDLPHHRLIEQYSGIDLTIANHRRFVAHSQPRPHKIAFVGDSNTFGSGLADSQVLANRLQASQTLFDVVNYGVPGYGFFDYLAVINGQFQTGEFDLIFLTICQNDVYPASAGNLALLTGTDERLVHFNDYDGSTYGVLKRLLFDHMKLLYFALSSWIDILRQSGQPEDANERTETAIHKESVDGALTLADLREASAVGSHAKTYRIQRNIYTDPEVTEKISEMLASLKDAAEAKGAKILFAPQYDFLHYEISPDPFRSTYLKVFETCDCDYLDLFDVHAPHYRETGYFVDPGHPGPRQILRTRDHLHEKLREMQQRSM